MQNRFTTYFNTAKNLILNYNGSEPLSSYLKKYFSTHKKHGSTDRKQITHWCYCYYRLGNALANMQVDERMKLAYFLCNLNATSYHHLYNEKYINNWSNSLTDKITFVQNDVQYFDVKNIFNYSITNSIDVEKFNYNFLQQQHLFLRIRPNCLTTVLQQLQQHNINYQLLNNSCLSLANTTSVENILQINKQVVVQDYASQQGAYFFELIKKDYKSNTISIWDCCAASGGKSILAKDVLQHINLTVSDVRANIIANLKNRFAQAQILNYQSFIADVSKPIQQHKKFQLIIADVPCTGSGTWARTPEQLYFFNPEKVEEFAILQKQIATNVLQHLQPNGYFLYITCSVFAQENEEVVNYILDNTTLQLVEQKYLIGYTCNADTMFAAFFKNE